MRYDLMTHSFSQTKRFVNYSMLILSLGHECTYYPGSVDTLSGLKTPILT